jgi:putative peptidoglycan lipid II flippase
MYGGRWKTVITIILLVITGKGLAFIREAFVASELGASSSADGYYLALAMPTVLYSLAALPFSMWVTARLAALKGSGLHSQVASFYSRAVMSMLILSVIIALCLTATANVVVRLYAPGLDDARLAQAVALARIGAIAIPALAIQAVSNGRLFADGRYLPVYVWLAIGGLVGLIVVVLFTPLYGPAAAVWAFVGAAWASIAGPIVLARPRVLISTDDRHFTLVDDLGASVVSRALVMQLYFQASLLLVYGFGSTLPAGELSASLFGSKVQTAVYETLAVTAGVLVYPRIAHFMQIRDQDGVGKTMMRALSWLLPATAGLVVLLIACRTEIVALIYKRHAFDDRAARLVASALLGYAPGIFGLTLVEIFHRTMVLRGRLQGYLIVFGSGLILNALCCRYLVPTLGVQGLTLSSSAGVVAAGVGLVVYASRRMESMNTRPMLLLVVRTTAAAALTLVVLLVLHSTVGIRTSVTGQIAMVVGSGLAAVVILTVALLVLGHRWRVPAQAQG